jgi:L-alanine-DL-glutamate epimerase-like enolase superfamily enzyme
MLTGYDVSWFEEPLAPDNLQDFILLRQNAGISIAGGEVLTRRQAFEPWISAAALDIVQPDVTKVGGISEFRRIAWMAEDRGLRVIPHGWNTAVGLAADLQLASALRSADMVEYLTGSPFIDELSSTPWSLDAEGMLPIPERPGLGINLNLGAVERYTGMRQKSL